VARRPNRNIRYRDDVRSPRNRNRLHCCQRVPPRRPVIGTEIQLNAGTRLRRYCSRVDADEGMRRGASCATEIPHSRPAKGKVVSTVQCVPLSRVCHTFVASGADESPLLQRSIVCGSTGETVMPLSCASATGRAICTQAVEFTWCGGRAVTVPSLLIECIVDAHPTAMSITNMIAGSTRWC
jgi:hypothetical protein